MNKDHCSCGTPQGALSQILGIDDELAVAVTNEAAVRHPANDLNREPTVLAVLWFENLSVLVRLAWTVQFHLSDLLTSTIESLIAYQKFRISFHDYWGCIWTSPSAVMYSTPSPTLNTAACSMSGARADTLPSPCS
jgi:hypothetical protein